MTDWCPTAGAARYADQQAAERRLPLARALHERGLIRRLPIRAYWCQHCEGWHLTSQPEVTS